MAKSKSSLNFASLQIFNQFYTWCDRGDMHKIIYMVVVIKWYREMRLVLLTHIQFYRTYQRCIDGSPTISKSKFLFNYAQCQIFNHLCTCFDSRDMHKIIYTNERKIRTPNLQHWYWRHCVCFNYSVMRKYSDVCMHFSLSNKGRMLAISTSDLENDVGRQKTP